MAVTTAARRPAAPVNRAPAPPTPTHQYFNFGDLANYVAGGGIPEGNYAFEFELMNYQATKQDGSTTVPMRFGVMLKAYSLEDPTVEVKTKFLSMGSKAIDSFTTFDGKKVVIKPDGAGAQTATQSSNWGIFLQHLYSSGLPQGIFIDDISVLDGVWLHLVNIPEPEERKGFQKSATAEIQDQPRQNQTIPVPTEVLPGGAPWEGGGGIPAQTEVKAAAGKPNGAAAKLKPMAAAPKIPAPAAVTETLSDEEVSDAATRGITSVLEQKPEGCTTLVLRTSTFKVLSATDGEGVANAVINTYFDSEDNLNLILEPIGYKAKGGKVAVG